MNGTPTNVVEWGMDLIIMQRFRGGEGLEFVSYTSHSAYILRSFFNANITQIIKDKQWFPAIANIYFEWKIINLFSLCIKQMKSNQQSV